jgi:hypothetical protein
MKRQLWLTALLVALGAAGCVVRARPVVGVSATVEGDYGTAYATVPPPSPLVEYRPPPPGYGYLWVDGFWDWTGYDWSWNVGYWASERPGYVYVRPQYVFDSGRWVYRRSYWNGPEGRRDYEWGRRGSPPSGAYAPVMRGAPPVAASPYTGAPQRGAPPQYGNTAPNPGYVPQHGGFGAGVVGSQPPNTVPGPRPVAGAPAPVHGGFGSSMLGGTGPAPAGSTAASPGAAQPQSHMQFRQVPWTNPGVHPSNVPPPSPTTVYPLQPQPQQRANPIPQMGGSQPRPTFVPQMGGFQPRPAPSQSASGVMGAGNGFTTAPRSNPAPAMGAHPTSGPARPAPSSSVPGSAHPAPAPVQGTGALKRGRPPGQ